MSSYQNLFQKLQKEANSSTERRSFGNEYLLKLKPGNTYTFRLLWLPPAPGFDREYPMINQYVHRHWYDAAGSKRLEQVYCPTSQYLMGDGTNAWNSCPICKKCGNLYKQYEKDKSQSAYDMWKAYHRTLCGYIPVYVVNSSDEDAKGVRILTYGKQMKDFFDRKIFGKVPKINTTNKKSSNDDENSSAINEDEIVGLDALMYLKDNDVEIMGCNFIVSVSTKKMPIGGKQVVMPQYNMDFSRKSTKISNFIVNDEEIMITPEYLSNLSELIKFDEDYYKKSTEGELQNFYNKYLVASTVLNEDGDADEDGDEYEDINSKSDNTKTIDISNTKPILTEESNIISDIEESENSTKINSNNESDIDVDDLISQL